MRLCITLYARFLSIQNMKHFSRKTKRRMLGEISENERNFDDVIEKY